MTIGIFISYRRSDSSPFAGRLYNSLGDVLGAEAQLFKDVDTLPYGEDFVRQIAEAIERSDVMLAVIGPDWLDVRSEDGSRRLDDPEDYVRFEIRDALARGLVVLPILVGGATIPTPEQLPEDLRAMPQRNGVELRNKEWLADVQRIVQRLRESLDFSLGDADTAEAMLEVASRLGVALAPDTPVVVATAGARSTQVGVLRRTDAGFTSTGNHGGIRGIGAGSLDHQTYEWIGSLLPPATWSALRRSSEPQWQRIAVELQSIAPLVRADLARGEARTVEFPPPIGGEFELRGESLHKVLEHDAARVADEIVATVKEAQLDAEAIAAVYLHGALADTPAIVDAVRARFGFDKVTRDVPPLGGTTGDEEVLPETETEVIIDRMVKKKRLRATIGTIEFGDVRIPMATIDGIGFRWLKETTNAITTNVYRTFIVWSGGVKTQIDMNRSGWSGGGAAAEDDQTYRTLVAIAQQLVMPRLLDEMMARLRGSASVEIGSITVTPTGLAKKGLFKKVTYLPWSGIAEVSVDGSEVSVRALKPGSKSTSTFASLSSMECNAPMLRVLVETAKPVFGSSG